MKLSEYFKNELNLIKSETLKTKVIDVLDNVIYQGVYSYPASSTGKYHPKFAHGEYGLGRHTKAMVKVINDLQEMEPDLDWDMIYASAILHDCCKYNGESKWVLRNHAEKAYELLKPIEVEDSIKEAWDDMCELVKYHMGRFDGPVRIDMRLMREYYITHIADMLVSRNNYGTKYVNGNEG